MRWKEIGNEDIMDTLAKEEKKQKNSIDKTRVSKMKVKPIFKLKKKKS